MLGTKVSVQRLFHWQLLFKKRLFSSIIRLLVPFPARRMLIFVFFHVVISEKEGIQVIHVGRARSLRSNLFFTTNVDAEQGLGGQNCSQLAAALALSDADGTFQGMGFL